MAISVEDREAKIGKPAPDFCCTAVDDEEFVEIKLRYFALNIPLDRYLNSNSPRSATPTQSTLNI